MTGSGIAVAHVYDPPATPAGRRVLVDRLWPRGLSKAQASLDEWCRDVAPSPALRRRYAHRPERFAEFQQRYLSEQEDADPAEACAPLAALSGQGGLTLLTAVRDLTLSHAAVLAEKLVGDRDAHRTTVYRNPRAKGSETTP
jgi:uncharacterized protein YeaO (DUF488 family)